jgi:6-phosphogluconolactonase
MDGNFILQLMCAPGLTQPASALPRSQETKQSMRKSFLWIAAVLALILLGTLMACSAKYSSQYNGLVVVPSRENLVMETFSLNLSNGAMSEINNVNGPVTAGLPAGLVIDPSGNFAYVLMLANPGITSSTGVESFAIASDGKLNSGTLTPLNNGVNPVALAIDSAGKYLFVADSSISGTAGAVSVLSISSGSLTEVPGSPFVLPAQPGGTTPSASALAVTPMTYPNEYAVCAQQAPLTTENLYVTDYTNFVVLNYSVNLSTGALAIVPTSIGNGVPTGSYPDGVAVDPCNRFVYVANAVSNSVSAYTICSSVSIVLNCPSPNFSLQPVTGSPYSVGDTPGPISVDAYGGFLYVVATGSSYINAFRIGSANGALTPLSPSTYALSTAVGQISGANSIAIRSDDSFLFVANNNTQTLSEFSVVPATGGLSPETPIQTFDYPSGVAVK